MHKSDTWGQTHGDTLLPANNENAAQGPLFPMVGGGHQAGGEGPWELLSQRLLAAVRAGGHLDQEP